MVSTLILGVDLVYGRCGLVKVADTTDDFVGAAERLVNRHGDYDYGAWLDRVDEALVSGAWDEAWARMMNLIDLTFKKRY